LALAPIGGVFPIPFTGGRPVGQSLTGRTAIREELILEATSRTALRKGDWVMIPPYKGPALQSQVNIELGNSSEFQLYNLKDDIGQQNNLAKTNPEKLQELILDFNGIRGVGQEIQGLELK